MSLISLYLGTYQSGRPVITIASFGIKLAVIVSKQRPRRLSLKGSDGRDYQYVLKGMTALYDVVFDADGTEKRP